MKNRLSVLLLGLALATASVGCTKDSELVSSCQVPGSKDGSSFCRDVPHGAKDKGKQWCTLIGALMPTKWEEDSLCNQTDALGGCKLKSGEVNWYYRSEKHQSSTDVESDCAGTFIP